MSEPEVRLDQLTGLRTILAPGSADRPAAFSPARLDPDPDAPESCPFCEGHEDRTPPEVWADRPSGAPDAPGWRRRAVPNLYPALVGAKGIRPGVGGGPTDSGVSSGADPLRSSARVSEPDLFGSKPASGAHEVIVNSPEHLTTLAELGPEGVAAAMDAWRARVAAHAEVASQVHLIVNEGAAAGATLDHTHAQLYALDFVPAEIARERERMSAYHQRTMGSHLLEDVGVEEVRRRERLVTVDEEALLYCPWASRHPFAMRLLPRERSPRFDQSAGGGAMLHRALVALAELFGFSPPLNVWVRTAPRGTEEFHWYIDIAPRLEAKGGFELGTGVDINPYAPERAAADLRGALDV